MLFLVKGYYTVAHYMREDRPERHETMHPVEAVDEQEARKIFEDHYRAMTDEYAIYYNGYVTEVMETLTKKVLT